MKFAVVIVLALVAAAHSAPANDPVPANAEPANPNDEKLETSDSFGLGYYGGYGLPAYAGHYGYVKYAAPVAVAPAYGYGHHGGYYGGYGSHGYPYGFGGFGGYPYFGGYNGYFGHGGYPGYFGHRYY